MRGHHSPVGLTATMLFAVAYVHVLLEPSAAVLAVAVAVRLLVSPVRDVVRERARRCMVIHRRPELMVVDRRSANDLDRRPGGRVS